MNVRVLGCHGSGQLVPGENGPVQCGTCGFLLNDQLLVDAGTIGSRLYLEEQRRIRVVVLTHLHFDHIRELPTLAESGLPGFESTTWFGVYGPKGLPAEITHRVAAELQRALAKPDVAERFAKLGAEPVTGVGPAPFAAMVKRDSARWAALIRERMISAE